MRNPRILTSILVLLALVGAPLAAQSDKGWSLDVGADYASRYLFRGVALLGENEVVTPHAYFTFGNFGIYYDGYIGKIPDFDTDYREDDVAIDYTFPVTDSFGFTVGAVKYLYNTDAERDLGFYDTYELYAIAAWDNALSPTISYYRDMDAVKGGYLQVGISHSMPIGRKASLDWSAAVGLDFGYNLNDELAASLGIDASSGDLNDLLIGIDIPVQVTDSFSFHVQAQESIALDVLDDLGVEDETVISGGLSFTF